MHTQALGLRHHFLVVPQVLVFGHGRKLSSLRLFSASLHYSYLTAKTSASLCRYKTHSSSQALITRLTLLLTHAMREDLQNTCNDIFVPAYNLSHGAWMRYRYINNRRWVMFLASKTEDNHIHSLKVPYIPTYLTPTGVIH